jgi:hypothetical protein
MSIIRDDFNWRDFIVTGFGAISILVPIILMNNWALDVLWIVFSWGVITWFLEYKKKSRKIENIKKLFDK